MGTHVLMPGMGGAVLLLLLGVVSIGGRTIGKDGSYNQAGEDAMKNLEAAQVQMEKKLKIMTGFIDKELEQNEKELGQLRTKRETNPLKYIKAGEVSIALEQMEKLENAFEKLIQAFETHKSKEPPFSEQDISDTDQENSEVDQEPEGDPDDEQMEKENIEIGDKDQVDEAEGNDAENVKESTEPYIDDEENNKDEEGSGSEEENNVNNSKKNDALGNNVDEGYQENVDGEESETEDINEQEDNNPDEEEQNDEVQEE